MSCCDLVAERLPISLRLSCKLGKLIAQARNNHEDCQHDRGENDQVSKRDRDDFRYRDGAFADGSGLP